MGCRLKYIVEDGRMRKVLPDFDGYGRGGRGGGDILGRIEKSIEIKVPPERVWEMLALGRLIEWNKGFKEDLKRIRLISLLSDEN